MSRKKKEEQSSQLRRNKKQSKLGQQDTNSIDPLNLPPRSKTMKRKEEESRPWWKLKYPLLSILAFLFILLPIGVVALVQYKYDGIFSNKGSLLIPSSKFEKVKITSTEDSNDDRTNNQKNNNQDNKPEENLNDENTSSNEGIGVKEVQHVVKDGETLFTISMKYYGNRDGEEIIQDENNLTDINLKPGQVLKIPINVDLGK